MEDIEGKKKTAESENKKMFRSRFDIFVLNALNDKDGASYGYDVINYIQSKTKGHYKIKTFSTIYNTLKRLEEQKYVISGKGDGETNGAARVYYTLTPEGRAYLEESKEEYKYLRTLLDNLLTDEDFDLENNDAPYNASALKPLTKRTRSDSMDESDNLSHVRQEQQEETLQSSLPDNQDELEAAAAVSEMTSEVDTKVIPSDITVFSRENVGNDVVLQNNAENNTDVPLPVKRVTKKNSVPVPDYKSVISRITAQTFTEKTPKTQSIKQSDAIIQSNVDNNKNVIGSEIKQEPVNQTFTPKESPVTFQTETTNLEKFRVGIRSEGYAFNSYKPKNATSTKFLYVNKLLRDSVVLSSLYFIICILVLFLLRKTFEFSLTALLVCGGIALSVALVSALIWFRNPDKRKKDTINIKIINLACVGIFTVFFMVDLIVALLIPSGKGLSSPATYSPVIAASVSLFYGIIFTVLYKTDNYSQR